MLCLCQYVDGYNVPTELLYYGLLPHSHYQKQNYHMQCTVQLLHSVVVYSEQSINGNCIQSYTFLLLYFIVIKQIDKVLLGPRCAGGPQNGIN